MNSITAHSFMDYGFQHKGRLTKNAKIANNTWFQTGGCAEYLFKPKCTEDLENFLRTPPITKKSSSFSLSLKPA